MKNYELIWLALSEIEYGSLTISLPTGLKKEFFGKKFGPNADIKILNEEVITAIIVGGDVAFGESYIDGMWDSSDLAKLLTFLTLNSQSLEKFFHAQKLQALILFIKSLFTKNTKRGSKKNIRAHYDLGNEFYRLWLDKTMTYSSALFGGEEISLSAAQKKKYQQILSNLKEGNILEIGCGWGGFAQEAAENGKEITCVTISPKQREFAQNRMSDLGLENLVKINLQDYREEKKIYDNVVSIEMFEAVGKEYWDTYFQKLNDVLKSGGKAILQIITIDEEVFKDYKNRVDFIQKHIFPGGVLPSKTVIRSLAKNHGFSLNSELEFGRDYAKTLEIWLNNFDSKKLEIKNMGFSEEFIRKWRFYLCYCIAGFLSARTDVVQFELTKLS
jgi:cyclopropane-fatty-acyl-phospholipid synthase